MRIGIDFDDVVGDSIEMIIRLHNKEYGTHLTRADFTSYKFEDVWGIPFEYMRKRLDAFFTTDQIAEISPVAGSIKGIEALKKQGHDLYIVTGRGVSDVVQTERWLTHHFPEVFKGVHYGNFLSATSEKVHRKKSDICKELGIELLIDDNLPIALECAKAGINSFLFDNPWNIMADLPSGITRVHSWEDIVKRLEK